MQARKELVLTVVVVEMRLLLTVVTVIGVMRLEVLTERAVVMTNGVTVSQENYGYVVVIYRKSSCHKNNGHLSVKGLDFPLH